MTRIFLFLVFFIGCVGSIYFFGSEIAIGTFCFLVLVYIAKAIAKSASKFIAKSTVRFFWHWCCEDAVLGWLNRFVKFIEAIPLVIWFGAGSICAGIAVWFASHFFGWRYATLAPVVLHWLQDHLVDLLATAAATSFSSLFKDVEDFLPQKMAKYMKKEYRLLYVRTVDRLRSRVSAELRDRIRKMSREKFSKKNNNDSTNLSRAA